MFLRAGGDRGAEGLGGGVAPGVRCRQRRSGASSWAERAEAGKRGGGRAGVGARGGQGTLGEEDQGIVGLGPLQVGLDQLQRPGGGDAGRLGRVAGSPLAAVSRRSSRAGHAAAASGGGSAQSSR